MNATKNTERECGLFSRESPKARGECWIVLCRLLLRQMTIPLTMCPNKLQEEAKLIAKPLSLRVCNNQEKFPVP